MFLLTTIFCVVKCVKIFPIDGTAVTLASGFNVKPSPMVPPELTTETVPADDDAVKQTVLPPQTATFELKTEIPSWANVQETTAATIEPTPKLAAVQNEPQTVTAEDVAAIAPTSVIKPSTLETHDVPAVDLLPPKVLSEFDLNL